MRKILIFTISLFVYSCGDSELTKFNNRVTVIQTLSESEGLSSNILSSYIDSVMIIKAQISVSELVNSEKDSLNKKLSAIYNNLRVSRAYNCMKDKTVKRTAIFDDWTKDKVTSKVEFITKDSVKISYIYSMSEASEFMVQRGLWRKDYLPKNKIYKAGIEHSLKNNNNIIQILINAKESKNVPPSYFSIINVNDVECKYDTER